MMPKKKKCWRSYTPLSPPLPPILGGGFPSAAGFFCVLHRREIARAVSGDPDDTGQRIPTVFFLGDGSRMGQPLTFVLTDRHRHGLVILSRQSLWYSNEHICRPRLFDVLDANGSPEVIVRKNKVQYQGARVLGGLERIIGRVCHTTPHNGCKNRWLCPNRRADFTGDGSWKIAIVVTPHLSRSRANCLFLRKQQT